MVRTKQYELVIYYKNGETDYYYSRLTGKYWETDAVSPEEALEEMQNVDPETFEGIAECDNVAWYEVVQKPLYRITGNDTVLYMQDEIVTFSTREEAEEQIAEWEELDRKNGWEESYDIIEVMD